MQQFRLTSETLSVSCYGDMLYFPCVSVIFYTLSYQLNIFGSVTVLRELKITFLELVLRLYDYVQNSHRLLCVCVCMCVRACVYVCVRVCVCVCVCVI